MTADPRAHLEAALGGTVRLEGELKGGGMSTVFLARDTALDRLIVVKLLPPDTGSSVSVERFKREIAVAARLQHPHIVPLYSAGEAEGVPFFTMPFVEGESLRERIAREGELPVDDAVQILKAIARALAYAHDRGVVHRDIKPDNVMLSAGSAMVTDFGVAKAISASTADGGTILTQLGVVLGTPAYMAPEQAAGEPNVDHRADLYALGCVAYEMFTGHPPFTGRSAQALMAAHATETPEPLGARRPSVHAEVAALVMDSLEKRPADRPQSAHEIVRALDAVVTPRQGAQRRLVIPAGGLARDRSMARWLSPPRAIVLSALGVALVAGGTGLWQRSAPASPPTRRAEILVGGPVDARARSPAFAVSADGSTIAYRRPSTIEPRPVMIRRLDRQGSTPVPRSESFPVAGSGAGSIALSADGRRVAYLRDTLLIVQNVDGTDLRGLPLPVDPTLTFAFLDSARVVYASATLGVGLVGLDGRRAALVEPGSGATYVQPSALPDGRHVLLTRNPSPESAGGAVLLNTESGGIRPVIQGDAIGAQWANGWLFYARRDGVLAAQRFDVGRTRLSGEPTDVGPEVGVSVGRFGRASFAVGDGVIAHGVTGSVANLVSVTTDGSRRYLARGAFRHHAPRVSPDGRRIVFSRHVGSDPRDVWVLDVESGTTSRLTSVGDGHDPAWTPDGRGVTFLSMSRGPGTLFTIAADGSGDERRLSDTPMPNPGTWLPDGSAYLASDGDIWMLPADGSAARALVSGPHDEHSPAVSPDGRWLAYVSNETGRNEVYVRALHGAGRLLASDAGGGEPVWGPDSRTLYYLDVTADGTRLRAVEIRNGAITQRSIVLQGLRTEPSSNEANWDIMPNGREFVFVEPDDEPSRLYLILDWKPPSGPR